MVLQAASLRNSPAPFDGQQTRSCPQSICGSRCVNQALVEDGFAKKFSGQARKCKSGRLLLLHQLVLLSRVNPAPLTGRPLSSKSTNAVSIVVEIDGGTSAHAQMPYGIH
jgi:hypothetical protein